MLNTNVPDYYVIRTETLSCRNLFSSWNIF